MPPKCPNIAKDLEGNFCKKCIRPKFCHCRAVSAMIGGKNLPWNAKIASPVLTNEAPSILQMAAAWDSKVLTTNNPSFLTLLNKPAIWSIKALPVDVMYNLDFSSMVRSPLKRQSKVLTNENDAPFLMAISPTLKLKS